MLIGVPINIGVPEGSGEDLFEFELWRLTYVFDWNSGKMNNKKWKEVLYPNIFTTISQQIIYD